jgi:thioester reductase-like protein
LKIEPKYYPYEESFELVQDRPCLVCHTSGSTGFPKPIDMTHAALAVYDKQRNLPIIDGRQNLSYANFAGHTYYTAFPPFHLAGMVGLVIIPAFYDDSTVVLPPPERPNNGATACEILRRSNGRINAMLSPPTVVEQLEYQLGGREQAFRLDFLVSAGGPLSSSAGNSLSQVTNICQFIGSTEIGILPAFMPSREDWSYFEWHPVYEATMELISTDALGGIYECVLPFNPEIRDEMIRRVCRDSSIPEDVEWRTKDLYRPHHTKENLWRFHGRTDDIIVLSNGEKFNPVTMEGIIQGHPLLSGALIVGQARFQAALIVEAKPSTVIESRDRLIKEIWPSVQIANTEGPDHGRIYKSKIIVASRDKPFQRVGKGTIIREQIVKAYVSEIDAVYSDESSSMHQNGIPELHSIENMDKLKTFVRACLSSVLETGKPSSQKKTNSARTLLDQDDFFVHGLDSLQTVELSHALRAGLRLSCTIPSGLSWLSSKTIYANPTVEALSRTLQSRQETNGDSEAHRIARMSAMIERYIDGLPRRASHQNGIAASKSEALTVVLTGSTGTLGINILQALLLDPKVAMVYCLNRAADARERHEKGFVDRGVHERYLLDNVEFLHANFGDSQLGLTDDNYAALVNGADVLIHNAWGVNFNQTLESFEPTHIKGIRNLIDLALASKQHAHIHFVSSLSSVGNWSAYKAGPVTEVPLTEYGVAQKPGYGESKHVSERILQIAHERCGLPINILRVGQVAGPSTADGTEWHQYEWLPSLVKTSKALQMIPETLTVVDWVPVDTMAEIIIDLVHSGADQDGPYLRIFNLLNPNSTPWSSRAGATQRWFASLPGSVHLAKVPFSAWIEALQATKMDNAEELDARPAAKILDFYIALEKAGVRPDEAKGVFDTDNGRKYSETFAKLLPIDSKLMDIWLRRWNF